MTITKQVERYGPMAQFIPEGVRSGDLLTLSGQVALDNAGAVVGDGDIAARVMQVYANVKEVLRRFDATMDNIVDEMWLVTDMQVGGLAMPGLLIEIKCIARV